MESARARNSFSLVARERVKNLEADLDTAANRVSALSAFCRTSRPLHRFAFDSFASALLPAPHSSIQALTWSPAHSSPERGASNRADDFSVLYVETEQGHDGDIGYNRLAARAVRNEVLTRAAAGGEPAISAPVKLSGRATGELGVLIASPVYRRSAAPSSQPQLLGFVEATLRIGNLAEEPDESSSVVLVLRDVSATMRGQRMYPPPGKPMPPASKFTQISTLSLGGRSWEVVATPAPGSYPVRYPYSYVGGALCLLFTLLLAAQVADALDRHWQVEREVEERSRELNLAMRRLEESQNRYRRLVDDAPGAIVVEQEGRIILANRAAHEMFGCRSDHIMEGHSLSDLVAPESREVASGWLGTVKAGPAHIGPHELRMRRCDGTPFEVEFAASSFMQDGCLTIQVVLHNITQRKQNEAVAARFVSAIEQVCESIVITDPEGNIVYVNPAFERVTGYSAAEAIGQNPRVLKSTRHPREFYKGLWATLTSGQSWSGRFVNRAKDGHLFTEEATISPVFGRSGQIVNYVAVKRDVTQEIELQEQLHQSRKMDAIGRLAGGVAHDFNNMLMVIVSYAELLASSLKDDDPLRGHTAQILSAAERSAALTRQLLTFSRKQETAPEILDCNALVTETSGMVQRLITENIELRCDLAPELWPVRADSGQIVQVIVNLCVNSRDAMPSGGTITMGTRNVAGDRDFVELSVSDSGIGIPPEVQERLFEPFFTTKERGKGTGLGLATVYGIVQQAGGHIRVESTPGVGSSFHICLPRCTETADAVEAPAAQPALSEGFRVLVVEDEDVLREAITDQLRIHGYQVVAAADGAEALELLHDDAQVGALVCDLVMPRMGGLELARLATEMIPGLHVVHMSGHADEVLGNAEISSDEVVFLQKPFAMSALLSRIAELRQEAPLAAGAPIAPAAPRQN